MLGFKENFQDLYRIQNTNFIYSQKSNKLALAMYSY